jgi:hypothetical protein
MRPKYESAQRLINAVYNVLNSKCPVDVGSREFAELIEAYDEYSGNLPDGVYSPPRDV